MLSGIEWKFCFVYLDDILVCSETFEEHLEHLKIVFERLREAGLTLKPRKCFFSQTRVIYLGHVISREGVSPDLEKTSKVRDFPIPTRVRQFLGLASYYRRFVSGFAAIAGPLHFLLKKDATFCWTEECQASFDNLKECLITAPVLAYPRFGVLVLVKNLLLRRMPVTMVLVLCLASLVWVVKHFRSYFLGHHTTVFTDHSACTSLLHTSKPSAKLARWAMSLT